jgi:hypothetical protein
VGDWDGLLRGAETFLLAVAHELVSRQAPVARAEPSVRLGDGDGLEQASEGQDKPAARGVNARKCLRCKELHD